MPDTVPAARETTAAWHRGQRPGRRRSGPLISARAAVIRTARRVGGGALSQRGVRRTPGGGGAWGGPLPLLRRRLKCEEVVTQMTSVQPGVMGVDERRVLACLVLRHVRSRSPSRTFSPHAERGSRASVRTRGPTPQPTVMHAEGPLVSQEPDRCEASQETLVTGLVDMACRQVQAASVKEQRREYREDPAHAL